MNHKYIRKFITFIGLGLFFLVATACTHAEAEHAKPFDPADWPTPLAEKVNATATPFPVLAADHFEAKAPAMILADNVPAASAAADVVTETNEAPAQTSALVEADERAGINMYGGPGLGFPIVTQINAEERDSLNILNTDEETGWVNAQLANGMIGWLNPADLNSADTPAPETSASETDGANQTSSESNDAVSTNQSNITTNAPTTSARTASVSSIALNMRSGPGLNFEVIEPLAQGDNLWMLAFDRPSGWVYIITQEGIEGWVNPNFLQYEGKLSPLPSEKPSNLSPQANTSPSATIETASEITTSQTASPATNTTASATSGQIIIKTGSGNDILIINRDGTDLRTLTTGIDPDISPDGTKVAFTRWDGANQGSLWVMNSDGTGERSILSGMRKVKSPSWSPDSKRVAVNYQEGGTIAEERKCQNVKEGSPNINPFVSYDIETKVEFDPETGEVKIFICWTVPPDPHWKMRVININDGSFEDMPAGQYAFAPTWDPANSWRVVSTAGSGLVQTDINQGVANPLTNDVSDRGPVFSPDGQYLAVSYKQHDHWEVHRLNGDGSNRIRLTKTPFADMALGKPVWNNASPTFSPDGTEIAFLTDRTGQWEVWTMNVDGSNQQPMFSAEVNEQLNISYQGNDERSLRWGS